MTQVAVFGPGVLYITRTDIANGTPVNIGYAQEFSLDEAAELKDLYGQNRYALAIATATIKTTGKIKAAMISGIAHNAVFHGLNFAAGQLLPSWAEAHSVPGTGPYTITITPPNSGTFDQDLGVVYSASQLPLTKVASAPATGQYSVAGAVYTFAAGDSAAAVNISYTYGITTSGQKLIVSQAPIGTNPTFQIDYGTSLNVAGVAKPVFIRCFNAVANKLAHTFKINDFAMPEIDFSLAQNASGNIYTISYPEVS